MSQSDIPSQGQAPRRSTVNPFGGVGVVPQSSAPPGSSPISGFAVSTYDTRPPNAFDIVIPPVFGLGTITAAGTDAILTETYSIPTDCAFVLQNWFIRADIDIGQAPPYPVPASPNVNAFLTDISGCVNQSLYTGLAPRFSASIRVNSVNIFEAFLRNAPYADYSLPFYIPLEPDSIIETRITWPSIAYYSAISFSADQYLLGTCIPSTGKPASEEVLTPAPIPTRET